MQLNKPPDCKEGEFSNSSANRSDKSSFDFGSVVSTNPLNTCGSNDADDDENNEKHTSKSVTFGGGKNFTKKHKFLHSKTKKRIIDPAISYINTLMKIYPKMIRLEYNPSASSEICRSEAGVTPHSSSQDHDNYQSTTGTSVDFPNKNESNVYNYTYGEINYDGIEKLYKVIMSMFFDEYIFIDLGSGNGKIPLYLSSKQQILEAYGIELVKERFDFSLLLFNKLKKRPFMQFTQKVHLFNRDMFSLDYSNMPSLHIKHKTKENVEQTPSKSIVWISNLCFGEEHTKLILEKLSRELSEDSLVCFSKIYESLISTPLKDGTVIRPRTKINNTDLIFVETVNIPMSWNVNHLVHIFIKKKIDDDEDEDEYEDDEEEDDYEVDEDEHES